MKRKTADSNLNCNRTKERIGINAVSTIVETGWGSGWQEYGAQNDDAIDGTILMRRGSTSPSATGGVVFVQVKCGGNGYRKDQVQHPDFICLQLGASYINSHMPRWKLVPGPAILIFVDDTIRKNNPPAWWVDLRSTCVSSTNSGIILIPKCQRFGHHAKGVFHRMCGSGPADRKLDTIELENSQLIKVHLGKGESLRNDAWSFYKMWRADKESSKHASLGDILVNRVGWKHTTRRGRSQERIVMSWLLLGAAREMIKRNVNHIYLGNAKTDTLPSGAIRIIDYLGLRANVIFPHRHQSVVQVVLKRQRIINKDHGAGQRQKIWFYSVFEPRRGKKVATFHN